MTTFNKITKALTSFVAPEDGNLSFEVLCSSLISLVR
jgi:hypothetical protein